MSTLGSFLRVRRDVRAIRRGPKAVGKHIVRKYAFRDLYRRRSHR